MKRFILFSLALLLLYPAARAEVTIGECVDVAIGNYPAIRKYGLLEAMRDIELSDIDKSWFPKLGAYGQLTVQNAVPAFPEILSDILDKMGREVRGLGKVQYKAGIDLSQTIWDGGASSAGRELTRRRQAVEQAQLDVELYQVRQKVENLYFAVLLTEEQIAQAQVTYGLLCSNRDRLRSMFLNGTAMQSEVDMVEAQALAVNQSISQARSAASGYRKALEVFTGRNLSDERFVVPVAEIPADTDPTRPELKLLDRRTELNQADKRRTDVSLMPRFGLFAQGWYGYPGFDYFQSMMNRDLSFNLLAGIKVSWNINSFYTKKNSSRRIAVNDASIAADRETFLFNTRVQTASQREAIRGLKELMADDSRIVELRENVRKAAESQLENGVIDVTALLTKISDENTARLTARYHEIMLVQEIYKLKYTLDR